MGRYGWVFLLIFVSSTAHGQPSLRTVALTGDPCPTFLDGRTFTSFGEGGGFQRRPVLNNAGRAAGYATCGSSPVILTEGHGSLSVIKQGDAVLGNGVVSLLTSGPRIDDFGDLSFVAGTSRNTYGFLSDRGGSLSFLAYQGQPAPGVSDGSAFDFLSSGQGILRSPAYSRNGKLATYGVTTSGYPGIWSHQNGSLNLVALEGSEIPGYPGIWVGYIGTNEDGPIGYPGPSINNGGDVAFQAESGSWIESTDGYRRIDLPSNCYNTANPVLNSAGQAAYVTYCGSQWESQTITSEAGGTQHIVADTSNPPPSLPAGSHFDTGNHHYSLSNPVITGGGHTVFGARVITPDQPSVSKDAFFAEDVQGFLKLLVAQGTQVPGMAPGVLFSQIEGHDSGGTDGISPPSANALGHVIFKAYLSDASAGIWLADVNAEALSLFYRTGQTIEVRPGDFRQIASLQFEDTYGSGGQDGRPSPLNDNDQFAFVATFTDGSSGVFVATIPEPAGFLLVVLGWLTMGRRRKR